MESESSDASESADAIPEKALVFRIAQPLLTSASARIDDELVGVWRTLFKGRSARAREWQDYFGLPRATTALVLAKYAPQPEELPRRSLLMLLRLLHRYPTVDDVKKDFGMSSYETYTNSIRPAMYFLFEHLDEVQYFFQLAFFTINGLLYAMTSSRCCSSHVVYSSLLRFRIRPSFPRLYGPSFSDFF